MRGGLEWNVMYLCYDIVELRLLSKIREVETEKEYGRLGEMDYIGEGGRE